MEADTHVTVDPFDVPAESPSSHYFIKTPRSALHLHAPPSSLTGNERTRIFFELSLPVQPC